MVTSGKLSVIRLSRVVKVICVIFLRPRRLLRLEDLRVPSSLASSYDI